MSIEIDETMQIYIEESLEHLADIENDFLAIEEAGENIDEDRVNKVYRAAHSIKGGAGFMGLTNIKDLTHEMENILGKIRSLELVPNPEIVNILLLASDAVRDLMNDVVTSNDKDISEHVKALKAILDSSSDPEESSFQKPLPSENIAEEVLPPTPSDTSGSTTEIALPGEKPVFTIKEKEITDVRAEGKHIYLVSIDLIRDIHQKEKTIPILLEEINATGVVLRSTIDMKGTGALDKKSMPARLPFLILFATILQPADINALFEIDVRNIFVFSENKSIVSIHDLFSPQPVESKPEVNKEIKLLNDDKQTAAVKTVGSEKKVATQTNISPVTSTEPESSLRVHVRLLDSLMNLAGELVLSRNQLLQAISSEDKHVSEQAGQRIDMITSELQEAIMQTRMQSIANVFNKFPRVVRDLAMTLGKNVDLALEGKSVELDKTIIEGISDPLTHLVRNAVDHGIETPEERQKNGKNPTGQVLLKAFHEAGQVNIEISDDGKGLDGDKIAASAVEKGLIKDEQVRMMSEKEKTSLIFLPGFSTAAEITDVSGRGVGMDVVKTNLDKLGGVVDIDSTIGGGTTIRIKLPLTLAIIPSQITVTGNERYAIPQVNLEELLRIPAKQVKTRIEKVGNAEVVRLRGNLLPLIKLADVIGIKKTYRDPENGTMKEDQRENIADRRSKASPDYTVSEPNKLSPATTTQEDWENKRREGDRRYHAASALNIVVVSTGAMKYGLVVDELHDSEEIVVKPLGKDLKNCKGYAGATIMGDGRVALILDVSNLAQMAGLTSVESTQRSAELAHEEHEKDKAGQDKQSLLLFRSAVDEQFAIPLQQVERIEKIKTADIETVGNKHIIQYRGGSLPLFSIDQVAGVKPLQKKEDLLVIVSILAGKGVGLMAMGPIDTQQVSIDIDDITLKQTGIMGSAIIGDQTTMLVDILDIVQTVNPEWFVERKASASEEGGSATILLAEDSNFFRNQVKGTLEEHGYSVIGAEDGLIAWDLLEKHADAINLVVTDIEMPNLNGFELTEKIKNDERYATLPIIALTTLAGDEDVARGKTLGIDDYQIKLDNDRLMQSIHNYLNR